MNKTNHPKLLTIFFWIFSAIQAIILLFYIVYLGFLGYFATGAGFQNGSTFAKEEAAFMTVFVVIILFIILLGVASIISNFLAGFSLLKEKTWSKKAGIIASVFAIISFMFGGILLLPFGLALGIYGLWFFLGERGKEYYHGGELRFNEPPSPPRNWE